MSTSAATLRAVVVPRTGLVTDAALVVAGALLVALCAQITIPLGFTPVPITAQTFAVLLVGTAYGATRGAASLALYVGLGLAGAPFYADARSGWEVVSGPTGGYLLGFVAAAWIAGRLAERRWDRRFATAVSAMLTGNVVIYAIGLPWLAYSVGSGFERTLELGLYPFVPGMLLKIYLAAALLPGSWRLVQRLRGEG